MTTNSYEAKWTGAYPNLCSGRWHLYKNDNEVDLYEVGCSFVTGPNGYSDGHANTHGTYSSWHFEDWMEVFDSYYSGLKTFDWIEENKDWLKNISNDKNDWELIYNAFKAEDWRPGSCGGCI